MWDSWLLTDSVGKGGVAPNDEVAAGGIGLNGHHTQVGVVLHEALHLVGTHYHACRCPSVSVHAVVGYDGNTEQTTDSAITRTGIYDV